MAGDARAGRLRDAAAARVDGQTAAAAAPAGRPVELHGRVTELAAEAGDAAHQAAVEDDAGAEARARRQDHERARAAPGAETPLREGQRVDVVVDEDGHPEMRGETRTERLADEIRGVRRGSADDAGVHRPRHADPDTGHGQAARGERPAHTLDQPLDRHQRTGGRGVVREDVLVVQNLAIGRHRPGRDRRPAHVNADQNGVIDGHVRAAHHNSSAKLHSLMPSAATAARAAGVPSPTISVSR